MAGLVRESAAIVIECKKFVTVRANPPDFRGA
jgi:hypothetical protein